VASLFAQKLQGFNGNPLYDCYTLFIREEEKVRDEREKCDRKRDEKIKKCKNNRKRESER